ncbi:hypothetical protein G7Z17_g13261 [Cylindrodendrum hubeiense]|uniref:Major facilitator superfamily (MFS) profile domain-containing protein n=1 Tax=Cylindrodendrum hubeiense TaxID=595255 RepID=A0A9P5GXE2_9HYPO|nr:hypothetical protein G7Z17_g13261 [Cylindrodendrum hubeiense]
MNFLSAFTKLSWARDVDFVVAGLMKVYRKPVTTKEQVALISQALHSPSIINTFECKAPTPSRPAMDSPTPEKQPMGPTGQRNSDTPLIENQPAEEKPQTTRSRIPIFLVLSLVTLTQAFDATCICVTLPTIASELDASVSESLSLGTTFLLATTVTQPIFSELSHVVGRKPAYLTALAIFMGGTIICGCARNSIVLLVGRSVQGAGAGGPQALSAVILTDLFSLRQRARWVSFLNISWALGTIAGPLLGGAFAQNENIGWGQAFSSDMTSLSSESGVCSRR